jgi:hypothetical protein
VYVGIYQHSTFDSGQVPGGVERKTGSRLRVGIGHNGCQ